jgi:glycosyltransferase involved in cell wall biosynthesis
MNFLVVASSNESIFNFRKELILEIQSQGFDMVIVAPNISASPRLLEFLASNNMTYFDLDMNRSSMSFISEVVCFFKLFSLIVKIKPFGLLSYTIKPNTYGMLAAFLCRVPLKIAMVTGLGYIFRSEKNTWSIRLVKKLYGVALKRADIVFFQNTDDQSTLLGLGVTSEKTNTICVNGSGVNLQHFEKMPLPDTPSLNFLMIGRLLTAKGVNEFVQAAIKANSIFPNAQFTLLGWRDDSLESISEDDMELIEHSDIIRLLPIVHDVRPILHDCHVFVLPSYHEGLPRSVIEAMAVGRPIITTDAPGCRDTVKEGFNGYMVKTKSSDELFIAMEKFILHPAEVKRMSDNSRILAEDKFDVRKVNSAMLSEIKKYF